MGIVIVYLSEPLTAAMSDATACPDCPGPRGLRRGLHRHGLFGALARRFWRGEPGSGAVSGAGAGAAAAETPECTVPLGRLGVGECGRVRGFAEGGRGYRRKLLAMGMTPGVEFVVLRVAPLGDPVEVRVRGSHLSLRKDEAARLSVERLGRGHRHHHHQHHGGRS